MNDKLTTDQIVRLLHAKSAELEIAARQRLQAERDPYGHAYLLADVGLLYGLVADYIESAT